MSNAKLTAAQVRDIKLDLNSGEYNQSDIAKNYGVSRSLISDIATGRVHKDTGPALTRVNPVGGQTGDVDAQNLSLVGTVETLREERNLLRRQLRVASKSHNIFESVAGELETHIYPLKPKGSVFVAKQNPLVKETLVLHLSDGHHDQVVLPEEVNGLEDYNFQVSTRRAEVLVDSTIKFTQQTLSNFQFDRLVILAYGDHTSGTIHEAEKKSFFGNQFKNSLAIGQLHALMFKDLAPYFKEVDILYLPGNHGRRTIRKEYANGAHNNWDYLVAKVAEQYCASLENVQFHIPNAFSAIIEIEGYNFHVSHGDDIASSLGQPWTGLRKRHERMSPLHNNQIDYYACGHSHTRGDVDGNGTQYLTNGAWLTTDGFAYKKMGVAGTPVQLLHGVHRDRGVTWRLPIQLKTKDELQGPQFYDIEVE